VRFEKEKEDGCPHGWLIWGWNEEGLEGGMGNSFHEKC